MTDAAGYESRLEQLTPRQREIAEHLVRGDNMVLVAAELGVAYWTVHGHVLSACERVGLEARSSRALVGWLVTGVAR